MRRENKRSINILDWRQRTLPFLSSLFLILCVFFAHQASATTNAKGVEIAFVSDNPINENQASALQAIDNEEILALTPPPVPFENNLWLRMQAGYAMPTIVSPYTAKYEKRYASKPDYVRKMIVRTSRYLFYVMEEVEKRDMPSEIALLPMIESGYNPNALSRSKALGIWQFMPATGKYFGLQQNWWVDNRRDVKAATNAALDYLEKLHKLFGSWDLALAAYNAGEGTVGRAIIRNKKAGLPTNYQSLRLPLETTHYVPKLQAIKNIVNNPQRFGLTIAPINNQAYFDEIDPPYQIDAKLAAKLAEITHEEFASLNPSYKRPIVASKNNTHKLLLPITSIETFQSNLNSYDKPLVSWKVYKTKSGEHTSKIAKKFNMSVNQLRKVNDLPRVTKLSKNLHLLVPSSKASDQKINVAKLAKQKTRASSRSTRLVTHKIKRGETLSTLAKRYGTNTRALMKINRLKSSRIKAGQTIRVSGKPKRSKTKRI